MSKLYRTVAVKTFLDDVVGYYEKATNSQLDNKTANAGPGNWTKFARDLYKAGWYNGNKNGYDWCATSFDWVIWMACGKDSKKAQKALHYNGEELGASCTWSVRYYKAAGAFRARGAYTPLPGDQIFFGVSDEDVSHTGMVRYVKDGIVHTMEGNVSNRGQEKSYSLSNTRIVGYGIPIYDGYEPPVEKLPFTDINEKAFYFDDLKKAYSLGIVKGTTPTTFSPDNTCTRAETVTMLMRMYDVLLKELGGG